MLYILLGNAKEDTKKLLKAMEKKQSVSWIVPHKSQIGDRVLFFLPKHGFVAHGEILGGHLKTGHRRTPENRPTEPNQNKTIYTSRVGARANIFDET
jgi:hypothetical protein